MARVSKAADSGDSKREIGARIRQARKEAGGMSQRELADLLGVTERSIQAYEQGETIPYRYGAKLESALGRPVAWFWYGEQALSSRDEQFEELKREIGALRAEVRKLTRGLGRFTKPA